MQQFSAYYVGWYMKLITRNYSDMILLHVHVASGAVEPLVFGI